MGERMRRNPVYPYIRCGTHEHPDLPGYIVCKKVLDGEAGILDVLPATHVKLGEITCGTGCPLMPKEHKADDMEIICAGCARELIEQHLDRRDLNDG